MQKNMLLIIILVDIRYSVASFGQYIVYICLSKVQYYCKFNAWLIDLKNGS